MDFSEYYKVCAKNLDIIDNLYEISEIVRYTELTKPDIVIIDFLQNISKK